MPNIFMKIFFQHPDQEFGWSEKYWLLGQTDLPGAVGPANNILKARAQMCGLDVTIRYGYVSQDGVFRDRLYLDTPTYMTIPSKTGTASSPGQGVQYIFNPQLLGDGPVSAPEVAALVRMYNHEGTQHGRLFLRGLPDKYFLTDPDAYFHPSGIWTTAFNGWVAAIGAAGDNAGARIGFQAVDKTAPKVPIVGSTNVAGLTKLTLAAPGFPVPPTGSIRVGRTVGTGLRINKVWKAQDVTYPDAFTVAINMPPPGFTWKHGGYVQAISTLIAPAANVYALKAFYTEHQTGRGITPHKGRQRKRTPDFIL